MEGLKEHDSWHQDDKSDNYANLTTRAASTSIHDYVVGKQVGKGAYATVRLAIHKITGKKIAIKIYEK